MCYVHVLPTKAVSHVCACDRDLLWSSCPPVLAPIMIRFGLLLHSPPYTGEDQCDCQGRHTTSNDANIKRVHKQVWANGNLWFCANTSRSSGLWCVHSAVMKCAPPPAECSSSCSCTVLLLLLLVLLLLLLIQLSTRPAPALRRTDEPPLHDKLSSHCIVHTVQYTISNESLHCSMCTFQSIAHLRLWPKNCTQYNVRTALKVNKCIAYLHTAQRTHCTLHTNLHNAQCWMWRINCPLQIANSTLHNAHCTMHIAYYTWLHIWYCRWLHYVQWAQC